jgi:hypothetical protein
MKFRPRFTVRTLAIFVTLLCAYFGVWEATKRYGVKPMQGRILNNYRVLRGGSPGPLLISCFQEGPVVLHDGCTYAGAMMVVKTQYLWLFGPAIRLPWESRVESPIYDADGELLVNGVR